MKRKLSEIFAGKAFWRGVLDGLSCLAGPYGRLRPPAPPAAGSSVEDDWEEVGGDIRKALSGWPIPPGK